MNYNDDDYSQGYAQITEPFRSLNKDDILQPYLSENDFGSSNDGDNIGYKVHSFGLGYKLGLRTDTDNAVLNKDNAINNAEFEIIAIEWYVPHYAPSISNQAVLSNQNLNKIPTELQLVQRSVFMREVNTQNFWIFELRTQGGLNVPLRIIVGFRQKIGKIHRI